MSNGLSISNTVIFLPLPPKWDKLYKIKKDVYISDNSRIFLVEDLKNNSNKILKVIISSSMKKNTLKVLSNITDRYLLLPEKYCLYNNLYYIIYPYKNTLLKKIFSNGITYKDITTLAENISNALDTLHKHHILHLDINPGNIFCNDDNTFCLGDYSSSVIFPVKNSQVITKLTPGYISPEISNGETPTKLSDYYMLLQTVYVLYNNGNNKIYNFNIDTKKSLQSNLSTLITELNISSDYYLHISDKTHPLFYLKTNSLQQLYTSKTINKHKSIINNKKLIYGLLIVFCASLMIKSYSLYHSSSHNTTSNQTTSYNNKPDKILRDTKAKNNIPDSSILYTSTPEIKYHEVQTTEDIFSSPAHSHPPEIKELDISSGKYSSLPDKYITKEYTSSVTSIYCCSCNLKTLHNITKFTNLQELYATDNNISNIDILYKIKKLNTLIISYNNLHDISNLSLCKNLYTLDLSGNNNMSNIKSLSKLKSLKLLNLTDTNVSNFEINFLKKNLKNCNLIY